MNVNNITLLFFVLVFFSWGLFCVFVVLGEGGRVRSGVGLARLVRVRDPASSCSGMGRAGDRFFFFWTEECVNVGLGWGGAIAVGVWFVSLATHLDTLCLCRLASIPLSLVSCLSRLFFLVCRASLVFCLSCSVSVSVPVFVCLYVCPCLSVPVCACLCMCVLVRSFTCVQVFGVQRGSAKKVNSGICAPCVRNGSSPPTRGFFEGRGARHSNLRNQLNRKNQFNRNSKCFCVRV